jgi:phospholipid/cholesterol/gamma-HCH transport system permease protein
VSSLQAKATALVEEPLSAALFAARAAATIVRGFPVTDTVVLTARLLQSSLPVVAIVAFASGAMLTVQAAASLSLIGGGPLSGTLVGLGGVREVFPLLAAASVAARSGAEFASAIGAMKVSEQVDALDVMGLDPFRLLIAPRVLAATLGTPFCVVFADVTGIIGSYGVGVFQLGIDRGSMWENLIRSVIAADLWIGIFKGFVLGFLIGVVSTWEGMRAKGGAKGVGESTNRAVVRAMIVVCLTSLLLTYIFYGKQVMG